MECVRRARLYLGIAVFLHQTFVGRSIARGGGLQPRVAEHSNFTPHRLATRRAALVGRTPRANLCLRARGICLSLFSDFDWRTLDQFIGGRDSDRDGAVVDRIDPAVLRTARKIRGFGDHLAWQPGLGAWRL